MMAPPSQSPSRWRVSVIDRIPLEPCLPQPGARSRRLARRIVVYKGTLNLARRQLRAGRYRLSPCEPRLWCCTSKLLLAWQKLKSPLCIPWRGPTPRLLEERRAIEGQLNLQPDQVMFYRTDDCTNSSHQADSVLFVHGIAESGVAWQAWVQHFTPEYRVISIDLPWVRQVDTDA